MAKGYALSRLCGLLLAVFSLASEAQAGPYVASRWAAEKMSQEDCLARAKQAVAATGLEETPGTAQTRYGVSEDYTGAVRCVMEQGIVFFFASGPVRQATDDIAGKLLEGF